MTGAQRRTASRLAARPMAFVAVLASAFLALSLSAAEAGATSKKKGGTQSGYVEP